MNVVNAREYEHDAFHRRVCKRVDGTLMQGFFYQDQLNPIAELDGSGNVVSRFVYATRAHVPDFMIRGNAIYAIITDHLGSVRMVVDTASGVIMQELEYDEFGFVLSDSNPGFQPFGFAGGVYDNRTRLTRFGAREYQASSARWTGVDPMFFGAGQTNLHIYVGNAPTNFVDPAGLFTQTLRKMMLAGLGYRIVAAAFGGAGGAILEEANGGDDHATAAGIGAAAGFAGAGPAFLIENGVVAALVGGGIAGTIGAVGDVATGRAKTDNVAQYIAVKAAQAAVFTCIGGWLTGGFDSQVIVALLGGFADIGLGAGEVLVRTFSNFDNHVLGKEVN